MEFQLKCHSIALSFQLSFLSPQHGLTSFSGRRRDGGATFNWQQILLFCYFAVANKSNFRRSLHLPYLAVKPKVLLLISSLKVHHDVVATEQCEVTGGLVSGQ